MDESLLNKIKEGMPEYKAIVLKNLLGITLAILHGETVGLYKLRGKVGALLGREGNRPASNYRRMTRFFEAHALSGLWQAVLCMGLALLRLKSCYLALDGTSWQVGERKVHLLTLSVIYNGVAIPIMWRDLRKKGVSSLDQRCRLIRRAAKALNLKGKVLLADREYIGPEWFNLLAHSGIGFIIRLRRGMYAEAVGTQTYASMYSRIMASAKPGKVMDCIFHLQGQAVRLVMVRNTGRDAKEPVICLITDDIATAKKKIASAYFIRWKIEVCFKKMKGDGFGIEAAGLKCPAKFRLLMAMVVFAYILAVIQGMQEVIPTKNYASGERFNAHSQFREGIDLINANCTNLCKFIRFVYNLLLDANRRYKSPKAIFV